MKGWAPELALRKRLKVIRKWPIKLTNFSHGRVCKPGELTHSKFRTTSPQFSRKSDPNVFVETRRSRTGSNYGRSFCIQWSVDSKDSLPSCSFSRLKELGPIHIGWKCQMEQEISRISKFPEKKNNLGRWTEIFETNFRRFSVPFDFEPEFLEILVEWNAPAIPWQESSLQSSCCGKFICEWCLKVQRT